MAITGATITAPTGALTTELLEALVTTVAGAASASDVADAYAAVGTAKVDGWTDATRADRAAAAWATYRALHDRAQQILSNATSASADGEGSVSYSTEQAKQLLALAKQYLAEYELEAEAEGEQTPALPTYDSRAVVTRVAW